MAHIEESTAKGLAVIETILAVVTAFVALVAVAFQLSTNELRETLCEYRLQETMNLRRGLARRGLYAAAVLLIALCTYPFAATDLMAVVQGHDVEPGIITKL